ncbi:MAG: hypothetical protein ACXU82_15750 [Caulobacteraceae bacterium]
MRRFGIAPPLAAVALILGGCHQVKDLDGKAAEVKGSYVRTCRKVAVSPADGVLTAECLDAKGQFHTSSTQASTCTGDLANMNGVLTCSH